MNTIRQSVRPKHQMLILKCYPRFQKNAIETKPNSSELSYLLYYASTRRSKLQKVGAFLEKKTISDVWRLRISNVQVTLQIVKALIEKCYRDLPLYSQSILNIFDTVLKSNDPALVEESVATFDSFVSHYETATLAADVEHARQFEDIVRQYAAFATKNNKLNAKPPVSFPLALRYRSAGLLAIKALVSSASFLSEATRHASIIMPAILDNTYSDQASYLSLLQYREDAREKTDKEITYRKRPSMQGGPRSTMDLGEGDALAAVGTTADLDQKAEEEIGALALQCLRQVFRADNRNAIRVATSALAKYGWSKDRIKAGLLPSMDDPPRRTWTHSLFELVCQWAPVQDRFMILVTVMETLIHSPIKEQDVPHQLYLINIIDSLLRSSVNLIGLSVMDVLLGLIQHVLLVLQLGGATSRIHPHQQQADSVLPSGSSKISELPSNPTIAVEMEVVQEPTVPRLLLVQRLRAAIGDLATHIYYADQVGDMVAALLVRLKPSPSLTLPSPAAAIADPSAAADAVASSAQLFEKPHTDGFFSFDTARLLALNAVRDIVVVANSRRKDGNNPSGRNPVDVSAWNGTQWLLRDQDPKVRRAYVEALLTWLDLETGKGSTRLPAKPTRASQFAKLPGEQSTFSKRAVSNASQKNSSGQAQRSSFLQLLHLAIYEHALQFSDSESDILLLHLLLSQCVAKLGINAVRSGLPMIFRLQEDIQILPSAEGKVCVGSLVHGYLWAVSDNFHFETSSVGRSIFMEIDRRTKSGAWLDTVHLPPLQMTQIPWSDHDDDAHRLGAEVAATASLRPFDARQELVDSIAESYPVTILSPPSSPPISPARAFSSSTVHSVSRSTAPVDQSLPSVVKEELLTEWTKEDCAAAAERELNRANSFSGSRVGSVKGHRSLLFANNGHASNDTLGLDADGVRAATPGQDGIGPRAFSPSGSFGSESDRQSVVRVSHLKEVLAGTRLSVRPTTAYKLDEAEDTASESMVSVDPAASNISLPFIDATNQRSTGPVDLADPGTAHVVNEPHPRKLSLERSWAQDQGDDDIPPVPSIPASTISRALSGTSEDLPFARNNAAVRESLNPSQFSKSNLHQKAADAGKIDLQLLLSGAKVTTRSRPMSTIGRPPY